MSANYEKIGPARGKVSFTINQESIKTGLDKTFNQIKGKLSVPGFRKGRVPRKIFNQMYGEEALYEDTLNALLPEAYEKALEETGAEPVGQPQIDLESMEKGQDWAITAEFAIKPEVKLGQYKDLEIPKFDREVTDEEVEASLEEDRHKLTELVVKEDEEPAENGDTVVIDYVGVHQGEEFEGGSATNHSLELGSGSFIPGFEDQLVGAKAGEEVEVNVTFPEEYHAEDLAGEDVTFQVTVHEVKEKLVPELDDDFAMDVDDDVDTLEELRSKRREELEEAKAESATDQAADAALALAVENAEFEEVPAEMIEEEADRLLQLFLTQFQSQGISPENFLNMTGMNVDDLRDQYKEQAEENVHLNLVLEQIAEAENLEVSEEDFDEEITNLSEAYNLSEEQVRETLSKDLLTHDILTRKAIELVTDSAQEVLEPEEDSDELEENSDEE